MPKAGWCKPISPCQALTISKFDFRKFLSGSGVTDLERIIISPTYVLALNDLVAGTPLDSWKAYLKWNVINARASQLTTAMDEQNFKFYGTTLTGRTEQQPAWRRGVEVVNNNLGEVVGKVYVEKHFPAEAKERMNKLVGNLIVAYKASINEQQPSHARAQWRFAESSGLQQGGLRRTV